MRYECLTHRLAVTVQDNKRDYNSPPGSWKGVPQCKLLTMKEFKEGAFGACEIKRTDREEEGE